MWPCCRHASGTTPREQAFVKDLEPVEDLPANGDRKWINLSAYITMIEDGKMHYDSAPDSQKKVSTRRCWQSKLTGWQSKLSEFMHKCALCCSFPQRLQGNCLQPLLAHLHIWMTGSTVSKEPENQKCFY